MEAINDKNIFACMELQDENTALRVLSLRAIGRILLHFGDRWSRKLMMKCLIFTHTHTQQLRM